MDRIRFQLDEHVSHAVARALRRREIDVLTPAEAGLLTEDDPEYLRHCLATRRVVVTHDSDFLRLHHQQPHAGIVYCEQGARTIGQIVASLVLIYEVLDPDDLVGHVEFI